MVVPHESKKSEVLSLMARKDEIEMQIKEFGEILISNRMNMTDPLVDESGFPRTDIDVFQVRNARHHINRLQNDLKDIMKEIEKGIITIHEEASASGASAIAPNKVQGNLSDNELHKPFAKVNVVSPGSPAEIAGIQVNDEILTFGYIHAENFNGLNQIGELVKSKHNESIPIKVRRENRINNITLVPRSWSGRGLLGCNIILLNSV